MKMSYLDSHFDRFSKNKNVSGADLLADKVDVNKNIFKTFEYLTDDLIEYINIIKRVCDRYKRDNRYNRIDGLHIETYYIYDNNGNINGLDIELNIYRNKYIRIKKIGIDKWKVYERRYS